ncbi:MAG TPA: GNAT family N-acetyltransferase [Terriglobales bacterium]|jgi:predicted N-acetyltransferase YhbS
MQIRGAQLEEADQISALINNAFRSERFFAEGERTNPEKIQALLETGKFLLMVDEGTIVGCIYYEIRGERGYFGLLAVHTDRQRSGIGAKLVTAAEQGCVAAGCRFMDLTIVNLRTELPGYYQRLGYKENGTLPFPADQQSKVPVHLVRMSKNLQEAAMT